MIGLASDLNLLGGHLAQDPHGDAGWAWSVRATSAGEKCSHTAGERVLLKIGQPRSAKIGGGEESEGDTYSHHQLLANA